MTRFKQNGSSEYSDSIQKTQSSVLSNDFQANVKCIFVELNIELVCTNCTGAGFSNVWGLAVVADS